MCACVCLVFYICMYMDMDLHTNLGSKMFKKIEFQARGGGVNGETLRMEEKIKKT